MQTGFMTKCDPFAPKEPPAELAVGIGESCTGNP